jgi:hypothetical protein
VLVPRSLEKDGYAGATWSAFQAKAKVAIPADGAKRV